MRKLFGSRKKRFGMGAFIFLGKFLELVNLIEVLGTRCGAFAGNDVLQVGNRKSFVLDGTRFCRWIILDPIRREDKIDIKRAVFDLDEIFSLQDSRPQGLIQFEAQPFQRMRQTLRVFPIFRHVNINILGRAGISQDERSAFANEKIVNPLSFENVGELTGLPEREAF